MYSDYLVLGGAGLVGLQVCRHIAKHLKPRRVICASLTQGESMTACQTLAKEFGGQVSFVAAWGNLFVPTALAHQTRGAIMADSEKRTFLLEALYDGFDEAYTDNHLVRMIQTHRPDVIVDCVNTATGLSYQDIFDGAAKVRERITEGGMGPDGIPDLEAFLLSQSVPQIIRHVRFVYRATTEYSTSVYLKVGTTGTGGMGLNIPYTHSEDKPSRKLLAKNEAAFGHTGLMFLFARTPGAPIVKELKPAAMIGYRAVKVRLAHDKHGNSNLFKAKEISLNQSSLSLREDEETYEQIGALEVPVVDTGENGVFTRGEFAAITALGQMEYITPEEIARVVVLEIRGANTGHDCISAMDGAVLNPSYKAGLLRRAALNDLDRVEGESQIPSVALGRLGPPELSKLLFEAFLLKQAFGSLEDVVGDDVTPTTMSDRLVGALEVSGVARTAPSIGIPVLMPDGQHILRGPRINQPELVGHGHTVSLEDESERNKWVAKGWIDLRPGNMKRWQDRFRTMLQARADLRESGSAAANIHTYMDDSFEIGEVVAWIFNNEMGGYRVK